MLEERYKNDLREQYFLTGSQPFQQEFQLMLEIYLVRQQLLDADLLILNKTELCSPKALAELHAWLPTMSTPGTPVVPANQARVPPELVLGLALLVPLLDQVVLLLLRLGQVKLCLGRLGTR
jgi:G3E family GTPase